MDTAVVEIYTRKGDPKIQGMDDSAMVYMADVDDSNEDKMLEEVAAMAHRVMKHEKTDRCTLEIKTYSEFANIIFTGFVPDPEDEDDSLDEDDPYLVNGIQFSKNDGY